MSDLFFRHLNSIILMSIFNSDNVPLLYNIVKFEEFELDGKDKFFIRLIIL